MTDLPTIIPTAEKITTAWGERCKDHDADCPCCQMWAMHDRIVELKKSRDDYKDDYFRRHKDATDHLERALTAESRLDEAREEALEQAIHAVDDAGGTNCAYHMEAIRALKPGGARD